MAALATIGIQCVNVGAQLNQQFDHVEMPFFGRAMQGRLRHHRRDAQCSCAGPTAKRFERSRSDSGSQRASMVSSRRHPANSDPHRVAGTRQQHPHGLLPPRPSSHPIGLRQRRSHLRHAPTANVWCANHRRWQKNISAVPPLRFVAFTCAPAFNSFSTSADMPCLPTTIKRRLAIPQNFH